MGDFLLSGLNRDLGRISWWELALLTDHEERSFKPDISLALGHWRVASPPCQQPGCSGDPHCCNSREVQELADGPSGPCFLPLLEQVRLAVLSMAAREQCSCSEWSGTFKDLWKHCSCSAFVDFQAAGRDLHQETWKKCLGNLKKNRAHLRFGNHLWGKDSLPSILFFLSYSSNYLHCKVKFSLHWSMRHQGFCCLGLFTRREHLIWLVGVLGITFPFH